MYQGLAGLIYIEDKNSDRLEDKLPYQNEMGYKDTFIVNEGEVVDILIHFPNTGMFMYHCHNLEHQEHGMMAHFEVEE